MNMLSPAAGMCSATEDVSGERSQGSQNIALVLDTTVIGANATSPSIQCRNKIMKNKSKTFKLSNVPCGDNNTPPHSGTRIGSLMNNSVISEHKQSIASSTNKVQEDNNMSNSDDNNLSTDNAKSAYTEKSAEDVMDTKSMSKIEDSTKVSKPGGKAAKNTNGTNKAKTHKGGILENYPPANNK